MHKRRDEERRNGISDLFRYFFPSADKLGTWRECLQGRCLT